ncbi:hypothetical protein FRB93_001285 [Tulasnella sp. JGI-2019a]|nr:hypothetical protein FRB93_001285 [Tulasnella sp. JGI-2019a]
MLLGWVVPIIRTSSVDIRIVLQANDAFGGLSGEQMLELLHNLSDGVEILKLEDRDYHIDWIIGELSRPTICDDRACTWLCPTLHTIHLKNCRYCRPEPILELVERRAAAAGGQRSSDGWPTPLRHLRVSGSSRMDDSTWSQITSILGDAAVWNISSEGSSDSNSGDGDSSHEGVGDE